MPRATLDTTDWRILEALQTHGRVTNVALASRVGISPPSCLRRVRALEKKGLIRGYYGDLNITALGFEVTVFAMVGLHSQAESDLQAFEARVADWLMVRECYMLNGDIDFILKCVSPNLAAFQIFLTKKLTPAPNVAHVRTALTIRRSKYLPGAPLEGRSTGDEESA
ncbi:MAG: Lrp/AsnC family transcriptional regulator [Parvularculales bacterium]